MEELDCMLRKVLLNGDFAQREKNGTSGTFHDVKVSPSQ